MRLGFLQQAEAELGPRDSLAGRLTRTLIVWVGGVWLLCVLGVAWYVDREINHNFDNELAEVAHRTFDTAVREFDKLHDERPGAALPLIPPPQLYPTDAVLYQMVDVHARVLLRSSEAPANAFDVPLAKGFADSEAWRIYTARHPTLGLYLQVADPLDERRTALNRTLLGLTIPLIAMLPLLALVLRNVARSELRGLQVLAGEIAVRNGADLRPIGLAGLPRELRSVGDDVNRLLERLSHALDVERALAANAAHELRSPLTAARLRLQTALEHDLRRHDVEAALDALEVLGHRAEKLLQLSRAESGASFARGQVNLVQLAGTVAQEFWKDARVNERLSLKVPDADAPLVLGDVDALAIALRNLVENALRYGSGRVAIEVMAPGTLAVRDFGPGVGSAQLRTLQQRHVRHSADRAGYGLGLSIVNTIVEKHGARLELYSPPPGAATGFEARIVLDAA
ncbi:MULTISPECIES: HAMP domain-containing sensor histidine kinase [unclassified Variovorax]|uniref:sensor histidine kinase n=1 Tax=unclassified Variovorax TaxID=663243 RepID=UPI00076C1643|nr:MULTISPECIES: HAMP domain-containing sensor histidine kinase [unclassified Variovorax]KWT74094.1 Sensor protein basS/pmrB [Variovorax sp. WDL1]PNG52214.1 Sensor protein QseC [Variovorax sp. B4]PNG54754.1 Sensor protein QseC [Variovorax sp. B2]VTV15749.1 Sensor protein QseC [Variovorax sp. WDL1]